MRDFSSITPNVVANRRKRMRGIGEVTVLLMFAISTHPAPLAAQVFETSVSSDGGVVVSYFTASDYELLEQRIKYSATQRVPDRMNSATSNYKTGTAAIVTWFGDRDADCRSFRGDLYYKNRSGPIEPKPGLLDPDIPKWLQLIPVESYAGTYCAGDVVDLENTVRTVNETWTPGGES